MKAVPNPDSSIRILKTATCPSLSNKSTLTYNVGSNAASEIQFCILSNSSAGFFSKEWIPMVAIAAVLDKLKGRAITSATFSSIFKGKSVNTSGFLLAVLKQEGLVAPLKDKIRAYALLDAKPFIDSVKALMDSAVEPAEKKPAIQKAKGKKA